MFLQPPPQWWLFIFVWALLNFIFWIYCAPSWSIYFLILLYLVSVDYTPCVWIRILWSKMGNSLLLHVCCSKFIVAVASATMYWQLSFLFFVLSLQQLMQQLQKVRVIDNDPSFWCQSSHTWPTVGSQYEKDNNFHQDWKF